jgi:hypothetical protein
VERGIGGVIFAHSQKLFHREVRIPAWEVAIPNGFVISPFLQGSDNARRATINQL